MIVYKKTKDCDLRLYCCLPVVPGKTAVLWVHGGGFTAGSAKDYLPHCGRLAAKGIAAFSVEYRLLSGTITLADCVSDVADAILYLRKHAGEWGIDSRHIVAVGESAGGYLVTALATVYGQNEGFPACPDAIVNCNGVVDLTGFFLPYASPLYRITRPLPPILHLQGKRDRTVPAQVTEAFHKRCLEAGGRSEIVEWEDAGHAFIVPGYTATEEQIDRAMCEIESFLERLW